MSPHASLCLWLALNWCTLFLRWVCLRPLAQRQISLRQGVMRASWLSGLNGVCHASALSFFPALPETERAVLSILLAGLCTAAIGTTNGHPVICRIYIVPVMGALALSWGLLAGHGSRAWIDISMALLIGLYLLILIALARDSHQRLCQFCAARTSQWQLNRRLREALSRAEQANAAKTRFLASASHDLRQPLHCLSLFFGNLRMHALPPDAQVLVGQIDQALAALRAQMNTLLDLSRLDAGVVTAHWQRVPLSPLLAQLHAAWTPVAHAKGLALNLLTDDDLFVHSDPTQLRGLLNNLLDNAIKFTRQGHVSLSARPDGDAVCVSVSDSGCGIAAEQQPLVFEEFFQLDNPERDRERGLGLGLSIARRLTDLLHIGLQLSSAPGQGSTFTLRIPAARPDSPLPAEAVYSPATWQADAPACHVLVIDDEATVREGMRALLSQLGCEVSSAAGVAEAVAMARASPPDIAIADLRLRNHETGIGAIAALRQHWPELPALIVTGDTAPQRLQQVQRSGLAILHKPVDPQALLGAITQTLTEAERPKPQANAGHCTPAD